MKIKCLESVDYSKTSYQNRCKYFLNNGNCFRIDKPFSISICPRGYSRFMANNYLYCHFFAENNCNESFRDYLVRSKAEKLFYLDIMQTAEINYILNNIVDYENNENCLHEVIHMCRDLDFINMEYEKNKINPSLQLEKYSNATNEIVFYTSKYNSYKDLSEKKLNLLDCFFPFEKELAGYYIKNQERKKALDFIEEKLKMVFEDDLSDFKDLSKKEKKYRIHFVSHFLLMHSRIIANHILANNYKNADVNYNVQITFIDHLFDVMSTISSYDDVLLTIKGNDLWPAVKKKSFVSIFFVVSLYILIENAKKYAVGEKNVRLTRSNSGDNILIKITNETDDLGVVDINKLCSRGVKGLNQKDDSGNGLGLYIVDSMMKAIGGTFRISLSEDKKIFIVEIAVQVSEK